MQTINDSNDPFDLNRFVLAQADDYATALAEVREGRKQSHWMWFVFPQFDGLGFSPMSKQYAIHSEAEARGYLAHPLLGPRLVRCCAALLEIEGRTANQIFGSPDDLKLRSSMTLFAHVSAAGSVFAKLLEKYFAGVGDARTVGLLGSSIH